MFNFASLYFLFHAETSKIWKSRSSLNQFLRQQLIMFNHIFNNKYNPFEIWKSWTLLIIKYLSLSIKIDEKILEIHEKDIGMGIHVFSCKFHYLWEQAFSTSRFNCFLHSIPHKSFFPPFCVHWETCAFTDMVLYHIFCFTFNT